MMSSSTTPTNPLPEQNKTAPSAVQTEAEKKAAADKVLAQSSTAKA